MDDQSHCGCCEGGVPMPAERDQAPGGPEVSYRAGTHATFKRAMLTSLSGAGLPSLARLRTRSDDDFAIATCDVTATLLDVLTFYQERHANELFLRTAIGRRSLIDLAHLIGYQPSPGVAAGTHLAFMLEEAPGLPSLAAEPVAIPAGTRVQSVPGPNQEPQTFETAAPVLARVEWNAIPVQISERQTFVIGVDEIFLAGTSVQIQAGDAILIVGDERLANTASNRWDVRIVEAVTRDNERDLTGVTLAQHLGTVTPVIEPATVNPRAYVFRQRVSLFGHNAPDPKLLFHSVTPPADLTDGQGSALVWANFKIQTRIDLDSSYPKILPRSWLVLAGGSGSSGLESLPGLATLYQAKMVKHVSRSDFGLSARVTGITPDVQANLSAYSLRDTVVLAQSEELPLAERPLNYPLYGTTIGLARLSEELAPAQDLAIAGQRPRLRVTKVTPPLEFVADDGTSKTLLPRDSFIVAGPPAQLFWGFAMALSPEALGAQLRSKSAWLRWTLTDRDGQTGILDAPASSVALQAPLESDPVVRELCAIADSEAALTHDRDRTTVLLSAPLAHVYDRGTTTVCANVARATHGETVSEIAGSGNAAIGGQQFLLKQTPLTYVSAATPQGRAASLEVRVDGMLWNEVPSLFEQPADARVYVLRQDGEGRTIVQFGDGVEGARLTTGQDNVRFTYRRFLGSAGNVEAGRLTTLLGRPLGVKTVRNVTPASGGEDAETPDDLRRHAPLTTLTLDRAVSIQDYTDFARTFAGIDKAQAQWIGQGAARGIFVTVAGAGGAAVDDGSDTMENLSAALRKYGDQLVPLTLKSYRPITFRLEARLSVSPDALTADVQAAVEKALRARFAFDVRDFGQPVSIDEVMAVIHEVRGVEGVDVDALYRADPGALASLQARLPAYPAGFDNSGAVQAAELLTLDPGPLAIGVLS